MSNKKSLKFNYLDPQVPLPDTFGLGIIERKWISQEEAYKSNPPSIAYLQRKHKLTYEGAKKMMEELNVRS